MTDEEEEADLAELTLTIRGLIEVYNEAPEGSASYLMAERALAGLVSSREMAQPIMEDMGLFMNGLPREYPGTVQGQILPLSLPQRRTSE
jgi:hypothetical protein